jgi:2,4-dienoyl-CoA reductase-like NADH-dependent reductase (Old Yellow Enzyme family)
MTTNNFTAGAEFPHLLSPLDIRHPGGVLQLRNRVLVSAHVPGFAEDNKPGTAYIDYHRRYAAEGVGLQLTGGTPVHQSGMLSYRSDALWNLDDSVVPGYQRLADAVHAEGGRMLAQLAHSGGTVKLDKPGVVSWSASSVRSSITGHISHEMSVDEIHEVIAAFAAGAARVRASGLDGVEVLAAFGFLPQAFLSPLTNRREDQYGGSMANRLRFLIELLTAVRAALGTDQILGVRLPGDEFEPGGLTIETMQDVCSELSQRGLVDYLNIIAHTNFTHTGRSKHWAPTPAKHGTFVDLASAIKHVVSIPVFTVGRIVDPRHAERVIADGHADMVGMTRAHICDPAIVRKIVANNRTRIRPCVGANTCIANRYAGKAISCMHNPELRWPGKILKRASTQKEVVVIGAGPAGLEAARLCAERGHSVRVYEKSAQAGGQLQDWARVKSTAELRRIVEWRVAELRHHGIEIEYNRHITTLDDLVADAVIVAIGAIDKMHALPGQSAHAGRQLLTPRQLLDLDHCNVRRALIVNDGRGQAGLVCAEWLLDQGAHVEIISEDMAIANDLDPTNRDAWYERLGKRGVTFTAQTLVDRVDAEVIHLKNPYTTQTDTRTGIDLIVNWQGCQADGALQYSTDQHIVNADCMMYRIGDCVAPRSVELAMSEALEVAQQIQ